MDEKLKGGQKTGMETESKKWKEKVLSSLAITEQSW